MEIYFTRSVYLLFLLTLPLIILIHFIAIKYTKKVALKFANFDALSRIKGVDFYSKNVIILFLSCAIIILLVFSLSGITLKLQRQASDFSFVLAIDTSESMSANDILPTRLDAAKQAAINFVELAPSGTRIAIVTFSGSAIVEQRITEDKTMIEQVIRNINLTSYGGTDISEALISSVNQLLEENSKSIILMSDGQINVGSLDQAIYYASKNNVVIHTIGIGTEAGGKTSYGLSKLDKDSLKSLAYNTKGTYTETVNKDELDRSFVNILAFKLKDVPYDFSSYALIAAIVLFIVEFFLMNTKFRIYP